MGGLIMSSTARQEEQTRIPASELRKLSVAERDAVLETQAELAVDLYLRDRSLTDFEAFGEDDLRVDVDDASTEER
jgi:hypothetical protein